MWTQINVNGLLHLLLNVVNLYAFPLVPRYYSIMNNRNIDVAVGETITILALREWEEESCGKEWKEFNERLLG